MNRKRISYREFIEQIKVKGNLYMPVIEGKNKMYPLIVTENHGEKIRTSDGRMHLSKMPELDMWVVYERCGQAFDEVTLKNMLAEYTEEYTRQAELDKKEQELFLQGLDIGDEKKTLPAKLEITDKANEVFITVQEGRFHQVKRMAEAVGRKVEYLKRISMGPLVLDKELKKGEYRPLFEEELAKLKESTASK